MQTMIPMMTQKMIAPYNMVDLDDDSVEVNLYGEVVSNVPTDFWTGERVEGLYIVLSDFLNDMETIKDKKNVTFHINSPGGEVFAGVSIYNRMKEFTGNVTTIVDGLAASAASIIAQGGKTRKVCNGSLTMIHGASSFMIGYYNANQLKDDWNKINAIDKSISEIYASCTGIDKEKIKNMMVKTTWMSAQEAVENGFADEVVDSGTVTMSLNQSKSLLTVNGITMNARGLFELPDNIPVEKAAAGTKPDGINAQNKGGEKMTVEELKKDYPDLVDQIRTEAVQTAQENAQATQKNAVKEAVDAEVKRLKEIDEIAGKIQDQKLVQDAKYGENRMSAGDLALAALKAQADAGSAYLQAMESDAGNSGANAVESLPNGNLSAEEQEKQDIANGAALIAGITK